MVEFIILYQLRKTTPGVITAKKTSSSTKIHTEWGP